MYSYLPYPFFFNLSPPSFSFGIAKFEPEMSFGISKMTQANIIQNAPTNRTAFIIMEEVMPIKIIFHLLFHFADQQQQQQQGHISSREMQISHDHHPTKPPPRSTGRKRAKSLNASIAKMAEPKQSIVEVFDYVDEKAIGSNNDCIAASQSSTICVSSPSLSCKTLLTSSEDEDVMELSMSSSTLSDCSSSLLSPTFTEEGFHTDLSQKRSTKCDCEAAWRLRSALRDDVSNIFQTTWQQAERQNSFFQKKFLQTFGRLFKPFS